jgi:hypothetical protein
MSNIMAEKTFAESLGGVIGRTFEFDETRRRFQYSKRNGKVFESANVATGSIQHSVGANFRSRRMKNSPDFDTQQALHRYKTASLGCLNSANLINSGEWIKKFSLNRL